LAERQQVRRQHLGPARATAFHADEERELNATIVALESGQAAPAAPELTEPQRQAAANRLIAERFQGTEAVRARALLGLPPA